MPDTPGRSRRRFSWRLGPVASVVFLVALAACVRAVPVVPQAASYHEFTVAAPRDRAFDELLRIAHRNNLSVHVLEKSSGLLRFETSTLLASQLDTYCQYPFTNSRTRKPLDTFSGWNVRALADGAGPVWGQLTLNVVMTLTSPMSTNVNVRGNWSAGTARERYIVNSRLVFEKELEDQLTRALHRRDDDEEKGVFEDN